MSTETLQPKATEGSIRMPDGGLSGGQDAPVGGQAVLEGVMMRGVSNWAVAVRKRVEGPINGHVDSADGAVAVAPTQGLDGAITVTTGPNGPAPAGDALGEVETHVESFVPWIRRRRLFRVPVVRGVVALVESLKIGFKALGISANAQIDEEEEKISGGAWGLTIAICSSSRSASSSSCR